MKGHPRPTGYRAYLEKVKITPNEQTSSTDAGESTDRSSNTESSQANGSITFKEFTFAARYVIFLFLARNQIRRGLEDATLFSAN